ncbi:MAG: glycosyltransferase family 39 protein [Gemmatimonadota bacterium]|nr:glycosyltransferase family 39 protein [Gemmatimonadota bacterium]
MALPLVVLIGLVLCVVLARRNEVSGRELERLDRLDYLLASRATPIALGAINALLVWWWVGWHRNPAPMVQDEAAYLLQAALFARGRWAGEAPPLPEFFAQMHVLTEPVLASKYPPGLSLLLAPFVAIGFAALGPMVFAAITGALVFVLARRIASGPVALLTWLIWSSGSALLRYQGSFLSQTATVALWLATFYFVLEYRTHHRARTLVAMGACVGMLAITRPVTAVALAVPVGIIVLPEIWRARAWRPLTLAALAAAAIVVLLPLQNRLTTGDWRLSPLVAYSSRYTPFDFPGFGYTPTRELSPLPPDLDSLRTFLTEARRRHTLRALPATLRSRTWYVTLDIFTGWRAPLLLFALLGALAMPAAGFVALAASAGLLLAYAFHAHWAHWTTYYFEGYPAIVFASATGLWAFAERVIQRRAVWKRLRRESTSDLRVRAAMVALCAFVLVPATIVLPRYRAAWQRTTAYQRRFQTALGLVERESPRSIVFVDYGRDHDVHSSLIWNVPDLAAAKTWIAHERGPDDLRLMRLAPDRRAYIFRADEGVLTRLPPLAELERNVAMGRRE